MSLYDIKRRCGHTDEINIQGTNVRGQREWRAAKLAEDDCFACVRAAKQRRYDILNAQAAEVAAAEGWPALTGSDKQTAWARDIRGMMIAELAAQITDERKLKIYITAALLSTDARWWIDRRDLLKPVRNFMDAIDEPGIARSNYGSIAAQVEKLMTDDDRDALAATDVPETPEDAPSEPETPQATIGALRAAGWTVAKISAEVGVSTSAVYRWATGTRTPNPANRAALALLTRS